MGTPFILSPAMSIWRRFDHGLPSLLTPNVEGRRPVFRDPAAARHLARVIHEVQGEERFNLLAWVIMPDHLHLVAWPPPGTAPGRVMKSIKGRYAREHQAPTNQRGAFWQSRYHEKSIIPRRGNQLFCQTNSLPQAFPHTRPPLTRQTPRVRGPIIPSAG